jgi:hypothetical protein
MTAHPILGKGYIPDPKAAIAARDLEAVHRFLASRLMGAGTASGFPLATANRPFVSPTKGGPGIWNQGSTGSCTGHGSGGAGTTRFAIGGSPLATPLSPIQPYVVGRAIGNPPDANGVYPPLVDQGAEPNQVVQGCMTFGMATIAAWGNFPADPTTINLMPTGAELEAAGTFLLNGAYFLDDGNTAARILGFIKACAAGFPVTNSIQASGDAFNNYTGGVLTSATLTGPLDHYNYGVDYSWTGSTTDFASFISALSSGDTSTFTAMLSQLVGYFVNSWSESWGWSDVPGLTGGLYQVDGTGIAGMADMAVWDITEETEAN